MIEIINNLKEIIHDALTINQDFINRYRYFGANNIVYPAVCYEPAFLTEEEGSLNQNLANKLFKINCYYLENSDSNQEMSSFIFNVEKLIDALRKSNNLNQSVLAFDIKAEYIDTEDKTKFGAKIIITGRMK